MTFRTGPITQLLDQTKPPVSIPFKREGLSERLNKKYGVVFQFMFQFPSNGKDFQNETDKIV